MLHARERNMQGQPLETLIRHQHIAAAAQHKQRHVLFARPRAGLGNLRLAGSLDKPPRRAPNSEGRQQASAMFSQNLQKSRLQQRGNW